MTFIFIFNVNPIDFTEEVYDFPEEVYDFPTNFDNSQADKRKKIKTPFRLIVQEQTVKRHKIKEKLWN